MMHTDEVEMNKFELTDQESGRKESIFDQLFENFEQYAENPSFCIKDVFFSYSDLNRAIGFIQSLLPDDLGGKCIAVAAIDHIETYAAIFAIWLKGGTYIPLGLHNPRQRNENILLQAKCDILLTARNLDGQYDFPDVNTVLLSNSIGVQIAAIQQATVFSDYAYILFTSGSTGEPKGVPISYGNLQSFLLAFNSTPIEIKREDRCLQMFELTFDVSISSFLPALLKGATVFTVPNEGIKYLNVLKILSKFEMTVIQIVPSVIRLGQSLLSRMSFPSIRYCILTGEATHVNLLKKWEKCIPNSRVFNFYGPTEATIYCAYYECLSGNTASYNDMVAIGSAFENTTLFVVDENFVEMEDGRKGELMIRGPQLTDGYLNNRQKNQDSFWKSPEGEVSYKSGDLCYKASDGVLYYCGRLDNQVKIQGFRIELSEIESCVRNSFDLNNVVITTTNKVGALELCLVIEAEEVREMERIIILLREKLPDYMIPAKIVSINRFPLGTSGKTDRNAIKAIVSERSTC